MPGCRRRRSTPGRRCGARRRRTTDAVGGQTRARIDGAPLLCRYLDVGDDRCPPTPTRRARRWCRTRRPTGRRRTSRVDPGHRRRPCPLHDLVAHGHPVGELAHVGDDARPSGRRCRASRCAEATVSRVSASSVPNPSSRKIDSSWAAPSAASAATWSASARASASEAWNVSPPDSVRTDRRSSALRWSTTSNWLPVVDRERVLVARQLLERRRTRRAPARPAPRRRATSRTGPTSEAARARGDLDLVAHRSVTRFISSPPSMPLRDARSARRSRHARRPRLVGRAPTRLGSSAASTPTRRPRRQSTSAATEPRC